MKAGQDTQRLGTKSEDEGSMLQLSSQDAVKERCNEAGRLGCGLAYGVWGLRSRRLQCAYLHALEIDLASACDLRAVGLPM